MLADRTDGAIVPRDRFDCSISFCFSIANDRRRGPYDGLLPRCAL